MGALDTIYKVVKGDTLSEIAEKYLSESSFSNLWDYTDYLAEINNIKNADYIVVGQQIKLSGEAEASTPNATSRATVDVFGLQSNTDRTIYVTWKWSKDNTENYQVIWYYDTGDNVWFIGSDTTVKDTQSLYTAPANALKVKVKIKPISKKKTVNDQETSYWTAGWSSEKTYAFSDNPPTKPDPPSIEIKQYTLTAELTKVDLNATTIEFQVVKNNSSVFATGKSTISTEYSYVSYSCTVAAGAEYKVRCRSIRGNLTSDWSDYSNEKGTMPSTPEPITTCQSTSETSVYLAWSPVDNATKYDIQYTTNKKYFDGSDQATTVSGVETTFYEKTGLTSGTEYFFRIRAVNDDGSSGWSAISSIIIGEPPAAPTTWSSTTTAIVGEKLTLYWLHNASDESRLTFSELEIEADGLTESITIKDDTPENEEQKTSSYVIDTTGYREGTALKWRVKTAGITNELGEWSIQRTVDIYAPPTLELDVFDSDRDRLAILESYPFYINALAGPNTQKPIGYHVVITSTENYETVDNMGNVKYVNRGDDIYSKYFDTSKELMVEMSADNLSLENNVKYVISCTVSMDSGLTTESTHEFEVSWTEEEFEPNAEIGIDMETYTAHIRPYCKDGYNKLVDDVTLSVYRREFDGTFTELGTGLDNARNVFITDPHPALDYARYRVVAKTVDTGKISYYDVPGYPVGGNAIIIQWDEEWSGFDTTEEAALEERPWTGSLLKLPYNIDVSDSFRPDTAMIEYIGRSHPVSYYGTHVGSTSTWTLQIPKYDKETLYGLRRLAIWMGDVYVREPSGSGYWANVTVSFSQKHLDVVIPVTLNITRVAGGA